MISLNVEQAAQILRAIDCAEDPIIIRSKDIKNQLKRMNYVNDEIDANILEHYRFIPIGNKKASSIRITFWGKRCKKINGTLLTMVKERLEVK